jgi:hypothetical protein
MTLKKVDVYTQTVLIVGSFIYALIKIDASVIYCYFIVGGWQVLSTALHLSITDSHKPLVRDRKAYNIFLIVATVTLPVGSYLLLLLVAPFAAVWYLSISFREMKIWEFRRFIQLK